MARLGKIGKARLLLDHGAASRGRRGVPILRRPRFAAGPGPTAALPRAGADRTRSGAPWATPRPAGAHPYTAFVMVPRSDIFRFRAKPSADRRSPGRSRPHLPVLRYADRQNDGPCSLHVKASCRSRRKAVMAVHCDGPVISKVPADERVQRVVTKTDRRVHRDKPGHAGAEGAAGAFWTRNTSPSPMSPIGPPVAVSGRIMRPSDASALEPAVERMGDAGVDQTALNVSPHIPLAGVGAHVDPRHRREITAPFSPARRRPRTSNT